MKKRTFLKTSGLIGIGALLNFESFANQINSISSVPVHDLAADEDFWLTVRNGYRLNPDMVNLENGYYNFLPEQTLGRLIEHIREINYQGSYYMRTVQAERKKAMAAKLAELTGCQSDELVITRNTTESLDIIISGYDWKRGDEAVMAEQDYPSMLSMFRQVARRHGIVNKMVSVPNHPSSDEEIVELYAGAITPTTRLLMICHMINLTGQILPVRKICDMAHAKGVEVMVDGAHAVGHFRFKISELGCDYYGSSLHKWLSVPLGSGLLWVKKEHISKIWPLMAPFEGGEEGIRQLNHTGTHPVYTDLTVEDAIEYYQMLGAERKEARLRYLKEYWTDKVRQMPHVILNTPSDAARSCGIANVGVKGMKPAGLGDILWKKHKIYTAPIDGANVHGCRITPNIYTTTAELDQLVSAIAEMV
ncbi:MAG: aminotransferase class V-fold PLP-dependent enzyme [Bacteroidales bacterium]|jgi:selenocysteine lyase/cysteine desulfurase|nr:aminotransferase class V-fold PLP-dependent enzyme [Bacteroidales bacterium]